MSQTRIRFGDPWNADGVLSKKRGAPEPVFSTEMGVLLEGDCVELLPSLEDESIDTVFADPPFNLGKDYGSKVDDELSARDYLTWCNSWIKECVRVIKPGGAFFLFNIPRWNVRLGTMLEGEGLDFRHWITVDIKFGLPIRGRLYPSHYSLLYYTKGKPKTFRKIRIPIATCRHCGGEIKDYGGHRNAMNPKGVNLTDVWIDVPPVRHWKFKSKKRKTNQISTKLVQRAVEISTVPGDVVLDPFGGSGTTFDVCEHIGRHWVGMELESVDLIVERLENGDLHFHPSNDFLDLD